MQANDLRRLRASFEVREQFAAQGLELFDLPRGQAGRQLGLDGRADGTALALERIALVQQLDGLEAPVRRPCAG